MERRQLRGTATRHRHVVLVGALLALACAPRALADYQVNSNADAPDANTADGKCETATPNVCTLRAAIQQANVTGGTITVPGMTIDLSLGQIDVTNSMTIEGESFVTTAIDAHSSGRIFKISGAVEVSLRDLFLTGGKPTDNENGGAIRVQSSAQVSMERCFLANNEAIAGGAVLCSGAGLSIRDSTLGDNHATSIGTGHGGAIAAFGCQLGLERSTLYDNTAVADGGALYMSSSSGGVVTNSTISRNTANVDGGAAYLVSGTSLSVYSSTVAANRGKSHAGGVSIEAGATAALKNTILAYNYSGADGGFLVQSNCDGAVTSNGGVIITSLAFCGVTGSSSQASPLLGPLQYNGGPTPTQALLSASPAIDAGSGGCFGPVKQLATDQRGVQRPIGTACDIGAFERTPCGDENSDGAVNVADVLFLINSLFAGGPYPIGIADTNGDLNVNVGDVLFLINYLFAGGPAPSCPGT